MFLLTLLKAFILNADMCVVCLHRACAPHAVYTSSFM